MNIFKWLTKDPPRSGIIERCQNEIALLKRQDAEDAARAAEEHAAEDAEFAQTDRETVRDVSGYAAKTDPFVDPETDPLAQVGPVGWTRLPNVAAFLRHAREFYQDNSVSGDAAWRARFHELYAAASI
jgi:hypothetical protein